MPAVFFLYEFVIRVAPSVIEGDLQAEFDVSTGVLGFNMSLYYYTYAPMQLLVGLLLDRLGGRGPLAAAALICGAGCVLFALATEIGGLGGARFLMGFGSAFAYVGTLYVATIWFPSRRIALLSGVTAALGMLGAVSAEAFLGILLEAITWREAFQIFAAVAVIIALAMYLLIPRSPDWYLKQVQEARRVHGTSVFSGLRCVLCNRQTWILAFVSAFIYLPIGTFAAMWGDRYLQVVLNFNSSASGPAVSMMFVGLGVVGPIIGWASDLNLSRAVYLRWCSLLGLFAVIGLLVLPAGSQWPVYALLLILGGAAGSVVVAFPLAMEQNLHHNRGSAMTFINFMQMILAGVGLWTVGVLLERGTGTNVLELEASDFRTAFLILPGCLVIAFVLALFLRDATPWPDTPEQTTDSAPLAD
jgi:sugar phosphate permease